MIVIPKNQTENVLLAQWACDILDEPLELFGFDRTGSPMFHTLGFSGNDKLQCVLVAYGYAKPNILLSVSSKDPRWATRSNIKSVGDWLFGQLGCERITALTKKKNKRSRKLQEGIGFVYEGKLARAVDDDDLILYALHKKDHEQWLRKAFNGKEKHISRAS